MSDPEKTIEQAIDEITDEQWKRIEAAVKKRLLEKISSEAIKGLLSKIMEGIVKHMPVTTGHLKEGSGFQSGGVIENPGPLFGGSGIHGQRFQVGSICHLRGIRVVITHVEYSTKPVAYQYKGIYLEDADESAYNGKQVRKGDDFTFYDPA